MNFDYLLSILNLYFRKETTDEKTNMIVEKKDDENIEFKFNLNSNDPSKTCFFFPLDLFEEHLKDILYLYKDNMVVFNEDYSYDNTKDVCHYYVEFKNGRKITFDGFLVTEIKNIRNIIYSSIMNTTSVNMKDLDDLYINNYQNNLTPLYTGFASFKSILLISLFFLVVLVVSLIYFM